MEIDLFLQAVYQRYGYDFRNYAKASIRRRVLRALSITGHENISGMTHAVLRDKSLFEKILLLLTVNITEMFRDPSFFLALRQSICPRLAENPFIKVWHAGCSTGEEVYSLAIVFHEEGLLDKVRIYATDSDELVLQQAQEGVFPLERLQAFSTNYLAAGGKTSLSEYFTDRYGFALMENYLKEKIVFANHNLVTDNAFSEVDIIICRNVLIYFNAELKERVFSLFSGCLPPGGFLCLGPKESIRFSTLSAAFEDYIQAERIYLKK